MYFVFCILVLVRFPAKSIMLGQSGRNLEFQANALVFLGYTTLCIESFVALSIEENCCTPR